MSYVTARCNSRLVNAERDQPLRIASLERKTRSLEEENVNVMDSDATAKEKQIAPRVTRTIRTLQTAAPI